MNVRRAPVPCLPAQISEGLSKTIVQQAFNLVDVENRNPADKCTFSVGAPGAPRTLLADRPCGDASPQSIHFENWARGASLGLSQLEGQLGTLDRPLDSTIRIPTKKTLARLSSIKANK